MYLVTGAPQRSDDGEETLVVSSEDKNIQALYFLMNANWHTNAIQSLIEKRSMFRTHAVNFIPNLHSRNSISRHMVLAFTALTL